MLVIAIALFAYGTEYEKARNRESPSVALTSTTLLQASPITETTTVPVYTTASDLTTIQYSSSPAEAPQTASAASTSSTTLAEPVAAGDYLVRYRGMGYHQAYVDVKFLCPSCVPAVARVLRDQEGVIAKSMAYKQRVSWVIYDPKRVDLDWVVTLIGGNGEARLLNDTVI